MATGSHQSLRPTSMHSTPWLHYRCTFEAQGPAQDDGTIVAYPGSTLKARIAVEFLEDFELVRTRAKLRYRAEGSGSPETHELVRRMVVEGAVSAGDTVDATVAMRLPDRAPISYDGFYVKINWAVVVEFLAPDGRIVEESIPVLVRPRPVDWRAGAEPRVKVETTAATDEETEPDDDDGGPAPLGFRIADPASITEVPVEEEIEDEAVPSGIRGFYDEDRTTGVETGDEPESAS